MEKTTVDLRALSDSQKTAFLEQARTFLHQRVEEEKYYRSFSMSSLEKDNMELNSNLTYTVQQGMSSLKDSMERLKNLKVEEKNLLLEIEELKKIAEAKTSDLERKVNSLKNEVKSLKILMNGSEQESWEKACEHTQS
jgi:hypothetical protein